MSEENKSFDLNKSIEKVKADRNLAMTVVGLLAAFVALFLPWYQFEFFAVSQTVSPGLDGDGLLITILAVVGIGAALNVLNQDAKNMRVVALVASILVLLIVFANNSDSSVASVVSTSYGWWLALLGGISATIGSFMTFNAKK
jgi:hypothetical protein